MMSKYRVQTGSLDVTVEAKNHRMAAIKAIDENNPKSLGLIVSILKEGDSLDDELFMKSEFILECMGYQVVRIITPNNLITLKNIRLSI